MMKTRFAAVTSAFLLCLVASGQQEQKIVLSLGAMSDVHIDAPDNEPSKKFKSALQQLQTKALETDPNGLAGVLFAGDIINNAYSSESNYRQVDWFKAIYESVFDPVKVPMVYTPGNHDVYKEWTPDAPKQAQNISRRLGENYFLTDLDLKAKENLECRHCVIGGCHILTMLPVGRKPVVYDQKAIEWLNYQLDTLTKAEPEKYVLILTHPMIEGTVYGSGLGDYWATSALTPVLEKYPQAVVFGGHLHFPLNDPRSIWQGKFTAVGCGSVRYMAIEDGGYEYMSSKTVMKDAGEFSQGLLLQFDSDGGLNITRMDFFRNTTIDEPWVLDCPDSASTHLQRYNTEVRKAENAAPVLSGLEVEVVKTAGSAKPVKARFAAGQDDEFVHHYVVTLSQNGQILQTKKILSDFYRHQYPSQMKPEWEVPFGVLEPGEYELALVAYDSWGEQSNVLLQNFKVSDAPDFVEGLPGYVPSEEILAARKQFSDDKFGIFIHWGVYSMLARGEWVLHEDKTLFKDYKKLNAGFYPSKFSAAEWVKAIKGSGAKYITITSRHHDGFSMFGTKQSPYNIVNDTPFGRDILKELSIECLKQGITLNFYYSLVDWGRDDYPVGLTTGQYTGKDASKADFEAYTEFECAQIRELLTGYGPVGCIWFDGDWDQLSKPKPGENMVIDFNWHYDRIYKTIHETQPTCMVANNHHRVPLPGEDIQVFERDVPGENSAGFSRTSTVSNELPLETCQTMNGSWGYDINDHNYKSTNTLIRTLVRTAGRNANLLLNIGPQPDGRIPDEALQRFSEMGKWMSANGETIYGTRATMLKPQPWGVLTHKDDKVYLHVMEAPVNGTIVLPFTLKAKSVLAYGTTTGLEYKKGKNTFSVSVPAGADFSTDYIIEITLK